MGCCFLGPKRSCDHDEGKVLWCVSATVGLWAVVWAGIDSSGNSID